MLDLLLDVVLRLEEAQPAAAVSDVVDVVRKLVDEVVDLADECRHERVSDRREEDEGEEVRDRRRPAAARDAVALEPFDGRVQRQRQEEGDEYPGEDVAGDPDHLQHHRHGDDRPENGQDRPQPKADQALRNHARSITSAPDVHGFWISRA